MKSPRRWLGVMLMTALVLLLGALIPASAGAGTEVGCYDGVVTVLVWEDLNCDGTKDTGSTLIDGVTVQLFKVEAGEWIPADGFDGSYQKVTGPEPAGYGYWEPWHFPLWPHGFAGWKNLPRYTDSTVEYAVRMIVPPGYYASAGTERSGLVMQSWLWPCNHHQVEFLLCRCENGSEPRTIGFWKNWRLRYSEAEMEALISEVKAGSQDFEGLTIDGLDAILDTSSKKTNERMATTQYLALWLNLASDRLSDGDMVNLTRVYGWNTIIDDSDGVMTVGELMEQMKDLFNNDVLKSKQQWEIFKNICDELNNAISLI